MDDIYKNKTREEVIDLIYLFHLQNTNGRETWDEMFKKGIEAAYDELSGETEFIYMQKCPKCDAQGTVSKPPHVAGDINTWISSAFSFTCDVCNGAKVIPVHKL